MREAKVATFIVVEDDDIDFKILNRAFKKKRLNNPISRTHDGVEALDLLGSGKIEGPKVILLDLNLPRMNGKEFLAVLRADPKLKKTVVFVLTTSADKKDIEDTFNLNVAGYFLKDDADKSIDDIAEIMNAYWQISVLPD